MDHKHSCPPGPKPLNASGAIAAAIYVYNENRIDEKYAQLRKCDSAGDENQYNLRCPLSGGSHQFNIETECVEFKDKIKLMSYETKVAEYLYLENEYKTLVDTYSTYTTEEYTEYLESVRAAICETAEAMPSDALFKNTSSNTERALNDWFRSAGPQATPSDPIRSYGYMRSLNPNRNPNSLTLNREFMPQYELYIQAQNPTKLKPILNLKSIVMEQRKHIHILSDFQFILVDQLKPGLKPAFLPNGRASFVFDKQQADDQKRRIRTIVQVIFGILSFLSFVLAWRNLTDAAASIGIITGGLAIFGICMDHYIDSNCENWHSGRMWGCAILMGYLPMKMYPPSAWNSQAGQTGVSITPEISRAQETINMLKVAKNAFCTPCRPRCDCDCDYDWSVFRIDDSMSCV